MSPSFAASESSPSDIVKWNLKAPGVLLLELNRPEKLNALSRTLLESLAKLLRAASESEEVRCVVLTGSRKAFSVGADIHDMAARGVAAYLDPKRLESWREVQAFPKPLIAAVNGYALGGGCELMMLCDIAIAVGDNSLSVELAYRECAVAVLPRETVNTLLLQTLGRRALSGRGLACRSHPGQKHLGYSVFPLRGKAGVPWQAAGPKKIQDYG